MKIGTIRRILKEDLAKSGELPGWIDQLLYPLNQFISVVSQALSNNLSLSDNSLGRLTALSFTHGVELQVDPQVKGRVTGVLALSVASVDGETAVLIDKWGWVQKSNGKIGVTFYFDGGSSSTVRKVTLFIMAG